MINTSRVTDISVLLPTRGRTTALQTSILSLVSNACDPGRCEILLVFDDDDQSSSQWFLQNVAEEIDRLGARYSCWQLPRLGYIRLNEYVNFLAKQSQGKWLMFWNDDAIMISKNWDKEITAHDGHFKVLRMPTHRDHPYAIFPIVPRIWFDLFGYISPHQISDAWVSQIAFMLDIMQNIPVQVEHDRHDLTGNNADATFHQRVMLEGRPSDPRDFNHLDWRSRRMRDATRMCEWLEGQGNDMSWFRRVMRNEQDPWEKMCSPQFDPNRQVSKNAC